MECFIILSFRLTLSREEVKSVEFPENGLRLFLKIRKKIFTQEDISNRIYLAIHFSAFYSLVIVYLLNSLVPRPAHARQSFVNVIRSLRKTYST